ncbi:dihydrolipoyl dehydrogenase [Halopenitus persicus]|uniref:Dihydrolipoyl dehydrogenase n=1 Tax=Halopenitus persicus TaxID=1048396 RepID=A0A1H3EAL4_9EURY|nr:dihydrolipoyl dehydrogenase [Halopenitus persicus]SDX75695.1 dihydrolipoamide dehydrogenase [Halopenitus persicus]
MSTTDPSIETDVAVIGAGPGGYVAAIRAAQHDLDVTLVERDAYGGVCLNAGCIPSKAYIHAADLAHDATHAAEMGLEGDLEVDMPTLQDWTSGIVDRMTRSVEKLCKANGVRLVEGTATFASESELAVAGPDAAPETISFEHAIVSTGSRPIEIPNFPFAADSVWSSRDALGAETVPDRLVVVGAGYIGMELSTTFAKLGADVTVVEMLDDVLPTYEDDVKRVVRSRAEELGIEFSFGEGASDRRETADGIEIVTETEDGEESVYQADRVLVAVGREPVTDTLELDAAGLEPDADGFLETDAQGRTDLDHVFAVGDVAGDPMLAHAASREGIVAAETIAGEPAALDAQAVPSAVFTDPEIATVGLTEAEATAEGFDTVVGEMPFRASGRAMTADATDGFVRIVADADGHAVLGAQIVGADASELIAEVTLAVETGATLEDVATTVHTHPTLAEAVMEAAENAMGQAIHTLNR